MKQFLLTVILFTVVSCAQTDNIRSDNSDLNRNPEEYLGTWKIDTLEFANDNRVMFEKTLREKAREMGVVLTNAQIDAATSDMANDKSSFMTIELRSNSDAVVYMGDSDDDSPNDNNVNILSFKWEYNKGNVTLHNGKDRTILFNFFGKLSLELKDGNDWIKLKFKKASPSIE